MSGQPMPPNDRLTIEPRSDQLAAVAALPGDRPVVMLNLLRFRDIADYSTRPDLAPPEPISGEEAYHRYGAGVTPHLDAADAEVVYFGTSAESVIGPADEQWNVVLLVRYPNAQAFVDMVTSPAYQVIAGHRTAALADSRLIPSFGGNTG